MMENGYKIEVRFGYAMLWLLIPIGIIPAVAFGVLLWALDGPRILKLAFIVGPLVCVPWCALLAKLGMKVRFDAKGITRDLKSLWMVPDIAEQRVAWEDIIGVVRLWVAPVVLVARKGNVFPVVFPELRIISNKEEYIKAMKKYVPPACPMMRLMR